MDRTPRRNLCRALGRALLVTSITVQLSPVAWAQLEDTDPALHAAVEALVAKDPDVVKDPELAQLCRQVAEATTSDPRERAAVTHEVVELRREGIDIKTIIPTEVREAAREEFAKAQGQVKERLETLRATDPERAKEVELMMREGERQMAAFEHGEHYTPSAEMVAHAEGMFKDWESGMVAQGAAPEFVERARMEFTHWSSGEMGGIGPGGPGHEFGGPGPGGMPGMEQMQQMVADGQMTPQQLEMAKAYMEHGPGPGGFETGPGPAGGYMPEGWARDQSGNFHYVDTEAYGPGPGGGYEQQGGTPMEAFEHWAGTEGQYREMAEQYQREFTQQPENQNYDIKQQQQFDTTQPPPAEYKIRENAHVADHNGDGIPETHMHEIYRHTQGTGDLTDDTCHDHASGATVGC